MRIGLAAPEGVEAEWEDQRVILPAGAAAADISWSCTPRRRGRYRFERSVSGSAFSARIVGRPAAGFDALELRVYPNLRRDAASAGLRRGTDGQQ